MAELCCNGEHRVDGKPFEIVDVDRKVTIALGITWGQRDLRADWHGDYAFCSFNCLAEWATGRALEHDQHVLVDGETPEGDGIQLDEGEDG